LRLFYFLGMGTDAVSWGSGGVDDDGVGKGAVASRPSDFSGGGAASFMAFADSCRWVQAANRKSVSSQIPQVFARFPLVGPFLG